MSGSHFEEEKKTSPSFFQKGWLLNMFLLLFASVNYTRSELMHSSQILALPKNITDQMFVVYMYCLLSNTHCTILVYPRFAELLCHTPFPFPFNIMYKVCLCMSYTVIYSPPWRVGWRDIYIQWWCFVSRLGSVI